MKTIDLEKQPDGTYAPAGTVKKVKPHKAVIKQQKLQNANFNPVQVLDALDDLGAQILGQYDDILSRLGL